MPCESMSSTSAICLIMSFWALVVTTVLFSGLLCRLLLGHKIRGGRRVHGDTDFNRLVGRVGVDGQEKGNRKRRGGEQFLHRRVVGIGLSHVALVNFREGVPSRLKAGIVLSWEAPPGPPRGETADQYHLINRQLAFTFI
jgi:hypothetical protein